ncbi:hypothetical protein ACFFV7_50320 [Nonomuraea spiralis]|uniref:Uncharacterized protein n=1 Tax=Nonomuraea spiralis TaxID=46182 RepID=A0ABV5J0F6_9ACTN|nr:hypothetical protein [Nonomuraea spiralis]GGS89380.1 hypothetical protein GCM10010176_036620 [Nonomuraea spiralis]
MRHVRRLVIASLLAAAWVVPATVPAQASAECYQIYNNNYQHLIQKGWSHEKASAEALIVYEECLRLNELPATDHPTD